MAKNYLDANELRILRNEAIIGVVIFILLLTVASQPFNAVSFAQQDPETYPIPGWKTEASTSPWLSNGGIYNHYNASNGGYNPYSTAPSTPHILWTYPLGTGGIIGFPGAEDVSIISSVYSVVAFGGKVYIGYQGPTSEVQCLDASTGEEIWESQPNIPSRYLWWDIVFAMEAANRPKYPMLFANGVLLDLETGNIVRTYNSPFSGASYRLESDGYVYYTSGASADPNVWCYSLGLNIGESGLSLSPVANLTYVWGPSKAPQARCVYNGVVLGSWHTNDKLAGLNATTGERLWNKTLGVVPIQESSAAYGNWLVTGTNGILYAFDYKTGDLNWQTSNLFTYPSVGIASAYGNHYVGNYAGKLYCLGAETGEVKWTFDNVAFLNGQGYTLPTQYERYGGWPFNEAPIAADGKVYAITGDHYPPDPMVQGEKLYCFNGTNGDVLWTYPCSGGDNHPPAIADGLLMVVDQYTNQLIAFGKGPTALDVSVSQPQISNGSYVWISGSVTDQSSGQKGTPCVSKGSMKAWMEYLHGGMTEPAHGTVTSVPVTLRALDSNNNQIDIGTVTTDSQGSFKIKWTPPSEDQYRIAAFFAGDESYYDSFGVTNLAVGPTPPAPVTPTSEGEIANQVVAQLPTFTTIDLVIIAAVIVTIGLVLYDIITVRKLRK